MHIKTSINYSPNFSTRRRNKKKIKYIVYHYTGMRSENKAAKRLTDVNSNVSCHYFIKRNGQIILMVPELFEAWHAGKSNWKKDISLNKSSIGIEISNKGHDFGYENFSKSQISSLIKLSKYLIKKYKIKISNILGHSDIAFERKKDPGEKFPWKELAKIKLAKWHKLNEGKIKKYRLKKLNKVQENQLLKNLYFLGYRNNKKIDSHLYKKYLITAFQRRFRQELINNQIDQECLLISENLVKKWN